MTWTSFSSMTGEDLAEFTSDVGLVEKNAI